jgi:hypothetical protein
MTVLATLLLILGPPVSDDAGLAIDLGVPAVATAPAERGPVIQVTPTDPPPPPPPPPPPAARGRCAEFYDDALAAGFTHAQWPTVDRLMYAESRCQPNARNPSGASGLMQVMPMWADDCGGTRADLFNVGFNLRCARHILNVQGWRAWSTY